MRALIKHPFLLVTVGFLLAATGCDKSNIDPQVMEEHLLELQKTSSFSYPLDEYFPEIPVTTEGPPEGQKYHAAEDCFQPAGTPVYAIGDGVIRYSGKARGYGWLIVIDHPEENIYSLYGHLSTSRWKKPIGEVRKGELIGHIGDPEECYTMIAHIHFGIRSGQISDYPGIGEWRWMAGHINSPPSQLGWFQPSEVIGKTERMEKWHRYIRKRFDFLDAGELETGHFKITANKYSEKDDLDQGIMEEFGDGYRLADWQDILRYKGEIEGWADSIGFYEGMDNELMVSREGYRIWLGRQYFLSRFNHHKDRVFLAHDSIDDDLICLGSWSDLDMHVLAVRK